LIHSHADIALVGDKGLEDVAVKICNESEVLGNLGLTIATIDSIKDDLTGEPCTREVTTNVSLYSFNAVPKDESKCGFVFTRNEFETNRRNNI
jgi:hypothetical protein